VVVLRVGDQCVLLPWAQGEATRTLGSHPRDLARPKGERTEIAEYWESFAFTILSADDEIAIEVRLDERTRHSELCRTHRGRGYLRALVALWWMWYRLGYSDSWRVYLLWPVVHGRSRMHHELRTLCHESHHIHYGPPPDSSSRRHSNAAGALAERILTSARASSSRRCTPMPMTSRPTAVGLLVRTNVACRWAALRLGLCASG
jgi:hypothetical protein